MRKLALVLSAAVLLAAGSAWAVDAPTEPIKVTNYGKKAVVTFDHAKHAGDKFTCVQCHHNEAEGKFKCGECHKAEAEGGAPKFQDAAHAKDVGKCWGCHRAPDAAHKLKCNDCHKE
jgi:hypothetical protein